MSDQSVDPFTQGAKAIFDALIAFPVFADEVRLGNRRSAVARPGAVSPNAARQGGVAPADFLAVGSLSTGGEMRVTLGGFLLAPFGSNSKISEARQAYNVGLATDVLDATRINRLKWLGLRALVHAEGGGGHPFGLTFVRGWTISDAAEDTTPDETTGVTGWRTAFAVNLEMYWTRSTL